MRGLSASANALIDLDRIAAGVLDKRLRRDSRGPVAVALSGGGDSVALLTTANAWAKAAGRALVVLTVDHGLHPDSAAWTKVCAARAAALGAAFRALVWTGDKPISGLPAAARDARHARLAMAAREAGATVILVGHTADDTLEARAMRAAGATTPDPREWSPSPAWPEGRGVFLLRPLLCVRRAEIRAWLTDRGETWIEDPANANPRYARARAREDLSVLAPPRESAQPRALAAACQMDAAGVLTIARETLRAAPTEAAAFVGIACLCAGGTTRAPAGGRLARLTARLLADGAFAATLAGARIEADHEEVRFLREPGEGARGGLAPLRIAAGATAVWDGRFEIAGPAEVRPVAGAAATLSKLDRQALAAFVPKARAALPISGGKLLRTRPLALDRLRAASGLIEREPA